MPRARLELTAVVTATAISATGTVMTVLAVPWFVLRTTGSAPRTGLVAMAELAGLVVSSVFAGPLIDRFGARRASVTADLVAGAAVGAIPALHAVDRLEPWSLFALSLLLGLSRGPGEASRATMMPAVAGRAGVAMERATSAHDGAERGARMLGGPAAGALIAWLGAPAVLVVDAGTFLVCAGLVAAAVRRDTPAPGPRLRGYTRELAEGVRYLRTDRLVRASMVLTMVTNTLDASLLVVLLPVYASTVLHSSVALGLVVGAFAAGGLLGAVVYAWLAPRLPRWPVFTVCFLVMGAPRFFVLLAEPGLPVIATALLVAGVAVGPINPILYTVAVERVPETLRGRVFGAEAAGAMLGMPIGAAAAGLAVPAIGLPGSLAVAGVAYLAATLCPLVFRFWREMDPPRPLAIRMAADCSAEWTSPVGATLAGSTAVPLPTPPGPTNFVKTMLTYPKAPLAYLTNVVDTYGDVSSFRLATTRVTLLRHPHHIRRVLQQKSAVYTRDSMAYKMTRSLFGRGLATVEGGEEWRTMRRMMQPSFHYQRVASMTEHMLAVIRERLERWDSVAAAGEVIDTAQEMRGLTLRIVARALFALEEGEVVDRFAEAIDTVDHEIGEWVRFPLVPMSVPTAGHRRYNAARTIVEEIIDYVIMRHLTDQVDRGDLLSMLIMTEDEESGSRLTDEQLRDQVMIMLWAGHETSANVLTWTWYRLGLHPEVQQRVLREVDDELDGRPPALADCARLTYTRSVLDEAMRMYPQAWLGSRRAMEDDEIGGFRIPAGTEIFFSSYHAHRHPDFWEEPHKFRPERFTAEEVAKRDRSAFFPFGSGPHLCIGNQFALTEMQLVIASALQRYRIELASQEPVEPRPLLTLGADKPIHVRLVPRARTVG